MAQCTQTSVEPTPEPTFTPTVTPVVGVDFVTVAPPTAVLVQTTPTQLPTPTVTPTPTSIVHLVQEGETLLGIAIENGTTVEEITAVNPGMNPDFLQIGQAVVLPPPSAPLAQTVRGTAVPIQVVIYQFAAYQTAVGSLWLLGEVVNEGSLPVEQVQVTIDLLDDANGVIDSVTAWTAVTLISPGEKAPFGVLITERPANFSRPAISIAGGHTLVDLGSRTIDVAVVETAVTIKSEHVQVTGAVENKGEQPVNQIILTATFYDDQGGITGFQQQTIPETLADGETAEFMLNATPPGSLTTQVSIHAEALVAVESN